MLISIGVICQPYSKRIHFANALLYLLTSEYPIP